MGLWDTGVYHENARVLIRVQQYDGTNSVYLSDIAGAYVDSMRYIPEARIETPPTYKLPMLTDESMSSNTSQFIFSIPINGETASTLYAAAYHRGRVDAWIVLDSDTAILSGYKIFNGTIEFPAGMTVDYANDRINIAANSVRHEWLTPYPTNTYYDKETSNKSGYKVVTEKKCSLPIIFGHYEMSSGITADWGANYTMDTAYDDIKEPLKINVVNVPSRDLLSFPPIFGECPLSKAGVSEFDVMNFGANFYERTAVVMLREDFIPLNEQAKFGRWHMNNYEGFGIREVGLTSVFGDKELYEFGNFQNPNNVWYSGLKTSHEILAVAACNPSWDMIYGLEADGGYQLGYYVLYNDSNQLKYRRVEMDSVSHETAHSGGAGTTYDTGDLISHQVFGVIAGANDYRQCVWRVRNPAVTASVYLLSFQTGSTETMATVAWGGGVVSSDALIAHSDGDPRGVDDMSAILICQGTDNTVHIYDYADAAVYGVDDSVDKFFIDADYVCGITAMRDPYDTNNAASFVGGWMCEERIKYVLALYDNAGTDYLRLSVLVNAGGGTITPSRLADYSITATTVTGLVTAILERNEGTDTFRVVHAFCNTSGTYSKLISAAWSTSSGTVLNQVELDFPFGDVYDVVAIPVSVTECYVFLATEDGVYYFEAHSLLRYQEVSGGSGAKGLLWAVDFDTADLAKYIKLYSPRIVTSLSALRGSLLHSPDSDVWESKTATDYQKQWRWIRYLIGFSRKIDDRSLNVVLASTPSENIYLSSMAESADELGLVGKFEWNTSYGISDDPEKTAGYLLHIAEGGSRFSMNWTTEPSAVDCSNWTAELAKREAHGWSWKYRFSIADKKPIIDHVYDIVRQLGHLMYIDISGTQPKLKLKYIFQKEASAAYTITRFTATNVQGFSLESYAPAVEMTWNVLNGSAYASSHEEETIQYGQGETFEMSLPLMIDHDNGVKIAKLGNQAWQTLFKLWRVRLNNYDAETDTEGAPLRMVSCTNAPDIWDLPLGSRVDIGSDYPLLTGVYWLWEKTPYINIDRNMEVDIILIEEPAGDYSP